MKKKFVSLYIVSGLAFQVLLCTIALVSGNALSFFLIFVYPGLTELFLVTLIFSLIPILFFSSSDRKKLYDRFAWLAFGLFIAGTLLCLFSFYKAYFFPTDVGEGWVIYPPLSALKEPSLPALNPDTDAFILLTGVFFYILSVLVSITSTIVFFFISRKKRTTTAEKKAKIPFIKSLTKPFKNKLVSGSICLAIIAVFIPFSIISTDNIISTDKWYTFDIQLHDTYFVSSMPIAVSGLSLLLILSATFALMIYKNGQQIQNWAVFTNLAFSAIALVFMILWNLKFNNLSLRYMPYSTSYWVIALRVLQKYFMFAMGLFGAGQLILLVHYLYHTFIEKKRPA